MSDTLKIASNLAIFTAHHERKIDIFYPAVHELGRLAIVERAATALIKCRGRYHAEQNTKALAEALGIPLPLPASDHPAEQYHAEVLLQQALEALEYHTQQTRPISRSINVIAALRAHCGHRSTGQYQPKNIIEMQREIMAVMQNFPRPSAIEQVMHDAFNDGLAGFLVSTHGIEPISKEHMYPRPSAIELQAISVGIPVPVTELINPA